LFRSVFRSFSLLLLLLLLLVYSLTGYSLFDKILTTFCIVFSGNPVTNQGVSSDTAAAITSPVIAAICTTSSVTSAPVATVPTTAGAVILGGTSAVTSLIPGVVLVGTEVCATYPAGAATVTNMEGPVVNGVQGGHPISASSTTSVTGRVALVTPMPTRSAEISNADSSNQTRLPSAVLTVQEQVSGGSSSARPSATINSVSTAATSPTVRTVAATERGNNRVAEEINHVCPYCQKEFPENIILHHKKLHYKKPFYSCLSCGKNFRTVLGLENHRCTDTAD
jgi:DNA-directed RNA polymerase subunit RPC12/RpoP